MGAWLDRCNKAEMYQQQQKSGINYDNVFVISGGIVYVREANIVEEAA